MRRRAGESRSEASAFAEGYGGLDGWQAMHGFFYVYRLRSTSRPDEVYTGMTEDLDKRILKHNRGSVPHTAKYRPWELEIAIAFRSRDKAAAFESYLKSGSGRGFARRHF